MTPRFRKRCYRIEVSGIVQGVGFRPFIYRLAQELDLVGHVFNHDRGVTIEVEGVPDAVECFLQDISLKAPIAARVDTVSHGEVEWKGFKGFEIRESPEASGAKYVPVSPDLALCEDCRREIWDVKDRRFFYPFTNCTNCGPRFTIIRDVPYDRKNTTMAEFKMCSACQQEYDNPIDRRFHAQPNACPVCGPELALWDSAGKKVDFPVFFNRNKTILERCAMLLKQGMILGIKGIGGFHIACDARNEAAVRNLRSRKTREAKPFAVMFPDLSFIGEIAEVTVEEAEFLQSKAAPIVLLRKKRSGFRHKGAVIAPSVAPGNRDLGVMLPYTPLHELLLKTFGGPLVMTSGNRADEPIAYRNEDALGQLQGIADYFLVHNRDIHVRCDDSVARVIEGKPYFYRRSRGFAPAGVIVTEPFAGNILALGAELKNVFCIGKKEETRLEALLSHHIGDLENVPTIQSFENGIEHYVKLFNFEPDTVVHDLHPDYLNTKWAERHFSAIKGKGRMFAVQHHHAHIAACMEENASLGPVIGVALDGTGFGPDGTIWGGEVLLADRRDYLRVGKMRNVLLPGGAASIRNPWRIGLSYALQAGVDGERLRGLPSLKAVPSEHAELIAQMVKKKLNCYSTSSCGRLFDAVSGLASVVREVNYEGQAAIELERILGGASLSPVESISPYPFSLLEPGKKGQPWEMDWQPVIRAVVEDLLTGCHPREVSLKFHRGLVEVLRQMVEKIAEKTGIRTVALSGGCFLNLYLVEHLTRILRNCGFNVLRHQCVPTSDGAIAFGQAIVANQILMKKESLISKFREI